MRCTFIVVALVGFCIAQLPQNITDPKYLAYISLFPIPGSDFVGFGYDARYSDVNQAVRLPLTEWNYVQSKDYKYPVYKQHKYKVPDELFVRTVARTDQNNYIYQSVEEVSERLAFDAGLNYTKSSSGPVTEGTSLTDGEKKALMKALVDEQQKANRTDEVITPQEAGYGSDPFIPATTIEDGNSMFSLGSEFNFLKSTTTTKSKYITQNEQVNSFYQLFLDRRKLRAEFKEDVDKLAGRRWNSEDRKLFINFFEKYGTHVVVSAMMGGAISMTSVVDNTAVITTSSVNFKTYVNANASKQIVDNQTITEEFIRNDPACVGKQDGFSRSTFTNACTFPGELTCYDPMTAFTEDFENSDVSTNSTGEGKKFRWVIGPDPLIVKDWGPLVCSSYRFCPEYDAYDVKWATQNDAGGPYTAALKLWDGFAIDVSMKKNDFVYDKGWVLDYTMKTGTQGANGYVETKGQLRPTETTQSRCWDCRRRYWWFWYWNWRCWCWQLYWHEYYINPMNCFYPKTCAYPNPVFYRGPVIQIGNATVTHPSKHLLVDSINQEYNSRVFSTRGIYSELESSKPNVFTFEVAGVPTEFQSDNLAILDIWDAGDPSTKADNKLIASFRITKIILGIYHNSNMYGVRFKTGDWYKVMLAFDWENARFDVWIATLAETDKELRRIATNIPFSDKTASRGISAINIYHRGRGLSRWDNLNFCNPNGGPTYVPLNKKQAIKTSTAKFKQTVNGAVDFTFENQFGDYVFSQTSNYRLKGGDSSQVDLLDLRKAYNTFETWKHTIMFNPAPVSFVLKKVSHLLPDEDVKGVNRRDEMSYAVDKFLAIQDTTSIIVERNPDVAP